jgi:hypothetical protein
MSMPRHTSTDDFAIKQIQSRKQLVVRHRPTSTLLQRKAPLSAVVGLNLTFLVDEQDQGLVGWIEIEATDIVEHLNGLHVAANLEIFGQTGFQTVSIQIRLIAIRLIPCVSAKLHNGPMNRIGWVSCSALPP